MPRPRRFALVCLTLPALVVVSGCGDAATGEDTTSVAAPATTATATAPPAAAAAPGTVTLDLTEYEIAAQPVTAAAGKVTFAVTNGGAIPHEVVVVRTDKRAGDLAKGSAADETGAVGEIGEDDLPAGGKKELTLDLEAGHYALVCNLPGHYQGGMYTDFTVK